MDLNRCHKDGVDRNLRRWIDKDRFVLGAVALVDLLYKKGKRHFA